jgi:hypothetical protein
MAWSRGYYYRSRKVDGRVEREYIGTGPMAEVAAIEDEYRRLEKERRRIELQTLAVSLDELDARVGRLDRAIDLLVSCALVLCGCRRHRRQWRRRGKAMPNEMIPAGNKIGAPPSQQEATDAIRKAEQGDRKALSLLRRYLKHPSVLARFKSSAESILRHTLGMRLEPEKKVQPEVLRRQAEVLAEQLAGPGASVLERLLADRIATCKLHVEIMEIEAARNLDPRVTLLFEKAADRASRRYLGAIKALTQLRKLAPDLAVLVSVGGEETTVGPRPYRAALGKVENDSIATGNHETAN